MFVQLICVHEEVSSLGKSELTLCEGKLAASPPSGSDAAPENEQHGDGYVWKVTFARIIGEGTLETFCIYTERLQRGL
jgi:hypothetical protein